MRIAWTTLVSLFPSKMPWLNKEQANGFPSEAHANKYNDELNVLHFATE